MKFVLTLVLLFSTSAFSAQPAPLPLEACKVQAPFGFPTVKKLNTVLICRSAYVLEHDNTAKIPAWVSYVLKPKNAIGCAKRSNAFSADRSLSPESRSTTRDYSKSGYDKGHMANSGDMRWSRVAERESFIMSNMAPQLPGFNRAIWKELEDQIRDWAVLRNHQILIYVGSIYDYKQDSRIGSGVTIPSAFYKIVIDLKTSEVLAFLFQHTQGSGDTADYMSSIAEVQRRAGVILPLPANPVLSTKQWSLIGESAASIKKETCSAN